ncbi:hypothetical protein COU76_05890 [Candidatus Peregrinibacteria bacterium CG10_big_fil_rev_8_21_14_0_10_49_10]|nr:MAG: hypothetical protein COU76_05890 [Candidatus Peregrinibacteria bacterium CG10_big_fil_rev_8_21_14_0_10_49_10]
MKNITLLCIGSLKISWSAEGCAQFVDRLSRELEIVELPASKEKDPTRQMEDESRRLLEAIEKRKGLVWVLDERGKGMTSQTFSHALVSPSDRGEHILFVLGGAYGLTDAVRERAAKIMRLSEMTLPHELCRLVFLEQLYRAIQIQKGTGYHH